MIQTNPCYPQSLELPNNLWVKGSHLNTLFTSFSRRDATKKSSLYYKVGAQKTVSNGVKQLYYNINILSCISRDYYCKQNKELPHLFCGHFFGVLDITNPISWRSPPLSLHKFNGSAQINGEDQWVTSWWLNQPSWKICKSQIGSFISPNFGFRTSKNIWTNHHPAFLTDFSRFRLESKV